MTIVGPVGQVAFGDIHNYGADELMGLGREQLTKALYFCRERLADVRHRLLFNWVVGWFLLGVITFVLILLTDSVFTHPQIFAATIFVGIALPLFFYMPIANRFGPMIPVYKLTIQKIEFVLHREGWL